MINKLKIGFLVAVLSLVAGVSVAHAQPLVYSSNTTVTLNGRSYTILAGSAATTVVVHANSMDVTTVPTNYTFTLTSGGGDTLAATSSTYSETCSGYTGSVVVPAGGSTTFTPTSTPFCTVNGGSGLSGGTTTPAPIVVSGGGGGGGGGYTPPATVTVSPVVTSVPVSTSAGCAGGAKFDITTGASCVGSGSVVSVPSTSSESSAYNFGAVTLRLGSRGAAVKELQRFLNNKLNLGLKLDGILGAKTIAVIKKWQKSHGLVADGLIGNKTKAMMNEEAETGGN
jgi:hypothetical protein